MIIGRSLCSLQRQMMGGIFSNDLRGDGVFLVGILFGIFGIFE